MPEFWIQLEHHAWDTCPHNIDRMTGLDVKDREGTAPVTVTLTSPGTGVTRNNVTMYRPLMRQENGKPVVDEALRHFGLLEDANKKPPSLPLGMRQRLQLAVACLHRPEVMILDESTSGVDPAARDMFWRLLGELSRRDGVTIFVSTHFMNEAERCDRISLMHAGKVLAVGTPEELRQAKGTANLENAFIAYLHEADPIGAADEASRAVWTTSTGARPLPTTGLRASLRRMWAFTYREMRELLRDWVRLSFALLGPLLLLLTFGYSITFDVENLSFAVVDRDHSADSRQLIENFDASRYFRQKAPLRNETEIDRRLRAGDLRLVVDIPPGFGRDLLAGRRPEDPARHRCQYHASVCPTLDPGLPHPQYAVGRAFSTRIHAGTAPGSDPDFTSHALHEILAVGVMPGRRHRSGLAASRRDCRAWRNLPGVRACPFPPHAGAGAIVRQAPATAAQRSVRRVRSR